MASPQTGSATEFSCPDCSGVLRLERGHRHRVYRCQVGHRFSTQSLLRSKDQQVEAALWSGAALLEQDKQAYERLVTELTAFRSRIDPLLQKRLREAAWQRRILAQMVETTHSWK